MQTKTSAELLSYVNGALEGLSYPTQPEGLYEPVRYVLSLGGKRIRPVLLLMAYNLYQDNIDKALPAAVGLEIYHNYTLLHDDLMDSASMRRGKPTVHKVWNPNTAILSGDSMLVLAYQYIIKSAGTCGLNLLDLFTCTALEIGEGQQYDLNFETRNDVTEAEYIEMIRLKTSVLLACALKMGAILGESPAKDADKLYRFGESLGLAFQLQDDYLDVYGDPAIFGKKIGGDILCNKKTYMLINAYRLADETQRAELDRWIATTDTDKADEKIAAVTALYNELGIPALCNERISAYFGEARRNLSEISAPEPRKQALEGFALSLLGRQS